MKFLLRIIFLAIGILLFAWTLHSVGLKSLWLQIGTIGWRITLVLAVYAVIFGLDTWGWHFSFPRKLAQSFRWHNLFGCRMAGEAVNYLTPFAALGGEPIKAKILKERHHVPWSDGLASLVIAKTSFVIGLALLILSGLGVVLWNSHLSERFKFVTAITAFFFTFLIGLFWILQQRGVARLGWATLRRWIPISPLQKISLSAGCRFDRKITDFYQVHQGRFLVSVIFHSLGWALGIVEVYLILRFLGVAVSWGEAWVIESLWQLVKASSFLIPASLGTQEGGVLLICTALGIGSVAGLALALVRRFRELVWTGLGLLLCLCLTQPRKVLVAS